MAKVSNQILEDYLENLKNPPKTFEKGQIIKGIITKMSPGEVFVDIGARAEGVVAGKELKLDGEKLDKGVGDEILVYVMKDENEEGQTELSIRRTGTARKWHDLEESRDEGTSLEVTVIEANTGGVIVEIGGGLRGFIPTSQLDNSRIYPTSGYTSKEDATQKVQEKLAELIGEKIEVKVIEIDKEKNRVIFSEKLVTASEEFEMREEMLEKSTVGDILEGEVTGIAPFGLFVNAKGLEGLVHLSEISWDKVSNPADFAKIGETVKVQIIGIEDDGKRIAYSIKRLKKDPWDEISQKYKVGKVVKGTVTKVVDYGAFVRIDDKVNGLIHISELSDKLVKDPSKIVSEGDEVDVEIISVSKEERHLGLSLKRAKRKAEAASGVKRVTKEVAPEMATLGELLEEKKEEIEEEE
ncbi:S1 RNA-binding domain-containing protein [Candidatus Dojkabacteria bacterium]|nr:S1 RNA-binding domain-containing protein [Candidatus Dojkabacteria bacterium]